jgi:pyruvate dehydrogenase E1 component beta subunit
VKNVTFLQAVIEAMEEEMSRDPSVIVIGQHLENHPFNVTTGLFKKFDRNRMIETPICESGEVGLAIGAAMTGLRPIVEINHNDFLPLCMDQIVNQAAKIEYMLGDQFSVPLVIHTEGGAGGNPDGAGGSAGPHHSQNLESLFTHVPGLVVIRPSTPVDAKGLMKTAIRSEKPVIFIDNKYLYSLKGDIPVEEYTIPFGAAKLVRKGKDLTLLGISQMVHRALSAAEALSERGIEVEIIDPRSLVPLDKKVIIESVKKTGRLMIVQEACERGGIGAEIAATVMSDVFDYLDCSIKILAAKNIPVPFSPPLERNTIPQVSDIIRAVKKMVPMEKLNN